MKTIKRALILSLLFFVFGCQKKTENEEYVANLHDGINNYYWLEDQLISNHLKDLPDRSVYLKVNSNSVFISVPSRYGKFEGNYNILSRSESGLVAEKKDDSGIGVSILQISPSLKEARTLSIGNNGHLQISRYKMIKVGSENIWDADLQGPSL